jgi:diguanylate cyclase (GGDEF)-like protein/PAS domain S-box-containing protein
MKSPVKFILLGSFTLLVLVGIVFFISSMTVLPGFERIEDRDTRQNVARVLDAFSEDLTKLNYINRDWSEWDDTYKFIQDDNTAYRKANLITSSLDNLSVEIIVFVRPSGQIVFGQGFDLQQHRIVPLPHSLKILLSPNSLLLQHQTIKDVKKGLVLLPEGPMLIVSRPILNSENKGPIRGSLVFGRFINAESTRRLAGITHLPLQFRRTNDPGLPEDFKAARASAERSRTVQVLARHNRIAGYALLYDIFDQPGLLLRVETPRTIFAQGRSSILYFTRWFLIAGLIFGAGVLLLFQKLTLSRRSQRLSEERRRAVIEDSADGILLVDTVTLACLEANPAFLQLTEYSMEELSVKTLDDFFGSSSLPTDPAERSAVPDHFSGERVCLCRDNRPVDVEVNFHRIGYEEWEAWSIIVRDITQKKQAEAALRASEERFRSLVRNASDVIAILDADASFRYVSPSAESVWGMSPADLEGKTPFSIVYPQDLAHLQALLDHVCMEEEGSLSGEIRWDRGDDSWSACEIHLSNRLSEPAISGIIMTCRDITERKAIEAQLAHQAFHDALTGLPNRALFMESLGRALTRAQRSMSGVAVIFIDLDGFKVINDSLGHDTGDQLLLAVSEQLGNCIRSGDTVARLGGDEFIILLEDLNDAAAVHEIADRIVRQFAEPIFLNEREIFTSASLGIAFNGLKDCTPDDLVRAADTAMYYAKNTGKARYVVFDPSMNVRALERLELGTDLRHALERNELRICYQPIIDMATGNICEVEALARWEHPRLGMISPLQFIPIAEETGLIVSVGQWILEETCRQLKAWDKDHIACSVNLSARQLQQDNLVEEIARILEETGIEPGRLKLEITESVMMQEMESTVEKLHQIKALGIQLAIDDFGTGYSSMAYLSSLPVDTLKIDRSFIQKIGQLTDDEAIIRAMISLAKTLNLKVTSEGIETVEQYDYLHQMGSDCGQGFYLSRPLPGSELDFLLTQKIVDGPIKLNAEISKHRNGATRS